MTKTCRLLITVAVTAAVAATGQPITQVAIVPTPTAAIQTAVEPHATEHLTGTAIAQDWIHTPTGMSANSTRPAASLTAVSSSLPSLRASSEVPAVADRVPDPPNSPDGSAAPYDEGLAGSAVGQLLSPSSSCTATMIPSDSGQIAVTAAHCVYIHPQRPQSVDPPLPSGWIEDLVFVPGRTADHAPHGEWSVARVWIDESYRDTADPAADVAFLELAHREGLAAQEVLGAEGIRFREDPPAGEAATMLGYPIGAPFDGTQLRRCTTPALTTPYADESGDRSGGAFGDLVAMACVMTEGSSGGPWLTGFDAATGTGTLTSVTSFRSLDDPALILAASLGPLAEALLRAADIHAGDTHAETEPEAGTRTDTGSARRAASGDVEHGRDVTGLPVSAPDHDQVGSTRALPAEMEAE